MKKLRLGTRGSRLAVLQARAVAAGLEAAGAGAAVEIVEIRTSGDRLSDVALGPGIGQSFFTKEIEAALLEGRIDVAVHSCKDLATRLPPGLILAAYPPREDPHDALVSAGAGLEELPAGARVGTGSVRRRAFLRLARPDLVVVDQRGNVPTRVSALDDGKYDAVILAVAGLRRLELGHRITQVLHADTMLPAAAQGALAIEIRADDTLAAELASLLDDAATRAEVTAERACMRRLEAGCQAPVGVLARATPSGLEVGAAVATTSIVRARVQGGLTSPEEAGTEAARVLLAELGVASLREAGVPDA